MVARTVAAELSRRVGQPVIVDNKPGAGGVVAADQVRREAPGGYTLFHVATPFSTAAVTNPSVHKYPVVNFTPVALTSIVLSILGARSQLPLNNIAELRGDQVSDVRALVALMRGDRDAAVPLRQEPAMMAEPIG